MSVSELTELLAVVRGDQCLNADACALFLGLVKDDGSPNRRGFLERIACRPDFPRMNPVTRTWRRPEVAEWDEEQRRIKRNQAA